MALRMIPDQIFAFASRNDFQIRLDSDLNVTALTQIPSTALFQICTIPIPPSRRPLAHADVSTLVRSTSRTEVTVSPNLSAESLRVVHRPTSRESFESMVSPSLYRASMISPNLTESSTVSPSLSDSLRVEPPNSLRAGLGRGHTPSLHVQELLSVVLPAGQAPSRVASPSHTLHGVQTLPSP
jgi:hypothetical protein